MEDKRDIREWVCRNKDYILPFFFFLLDEFSKKHLWAKIGIPVIKKFIELTIKNYCDGKEKK